LTRQRKGPAGKKARLKATVEKGEGTLDRHVEEDFATPREERGDEGVSQGSDEIILYFFERSQLR